MLCVVVRADNVVEAYASPADVTTCSSVLISGAEYVSLHQQNPFAISVTDAVIISSAIVSCWAVAFAFRALARFVSHDTSTGSFKDE